jgi:hypothetical protein
MRYSRYCRYFPGQRGMTAGVRAEALAFLDQVSAPLTPRQIERALRDHGVAKSQRAVLAGSLSHHNINAVTAKDSEK